MPVEAFAVNRLVLQVNLFSGSDPSRVSGRLCIWTNDENVDPSQFSTFADFRKTLRLKCDTNKVSAYFQFTPDEKTPDTLYYQVCNSLFKFYGVGENIYPKVVVPKKSL
ncbi:hypothetical protein OESDEN_19148 [Oesophagostomum dentatum]|uniref:Uncharacterized protein n=1 Tax=Oesophagostomum dentatum TaxID=61180 RepID=A0A0B1SBD3_OESDE|nr:hypothetical protein OESDEN_19148 [Oesophagostomum dentatum]